MLSLVVDVEVVSGAEVESEVDVEVVELPLAAVDSKELEDDGQVVQSPHAGGIAVAADDHAGPLLSQGAP